jgi:lysozyme
MPEELETWQEQLEADLVRDEDEVLHAYQDSEGYWTIGAGILIDKRRGGGITREESRYLLRNRVARTMASLSERLPWWSELSPNRQRALVNMAFNLGLDGLLEFKRFLAALQARRWADAVAEMKDSRWARQVGERARRLMVLIERG